MREAIDSEALAPFRDDEAFLGLLIDEFFVEAPRRIQVLRAAYANRDVAALRSEGHALKGSARIFGAAPLAALCEALEGTQVIDARTGDRLAQVRREYERVRAALEECRVSKHEGIRS